MNLRNIKALLRRRFNIPKERPVRRAIRAFTLAERTVFYFFAAIFILSGFSLLWKVSEAFLQEVPIEGGTLVEGTVGNPRFINPVLALSEADKNLTSLVYSGLVRVSPRGVIENDLAKEIQVSENLLSYTVAIHPEARFHDGAKVTADDVIFTIQKIIDPLLKSPRRGNWDGISVEKLDDLTLVFKLKKPYAPFIYNLQLGILPRHIWKNVTADEFSFSQFNTLPVGSGPYKVEKVERNQGGIPDYYELVPFRSSLGRNAYVRKLVMRFYPSEDALVEAFNKGDVESVAGISADKLPNLELRGKKVVESPLPRIFAVFFNQGQSPVLKERAVREALALAAPKEEIVEKVFAGYATAIDGPLPAGLYDWTAEPSPKQTADTYLEMAREILSKAGWQKNENTGLLEKKSGKDTIALSFSISTGDAPELRKVADELAAAWRKLGADVKVLSFETGELNQSVIRPRQFEALLFGEMVGREADIYPFWHSSQRNDPGLNIALYANSKVDRFLEEARSGGNATQVESSYKALAEEFKRDVPAIFLYTPNFLYILPDDVRAVSLGALASSHDRFSGIRDWYIETDKVWNIFLD